MSASFWGLGRQIDGPICTIRANQFAYWRANQAIRTIRGNQGSKDEPFFGRIAFRGLKIANRRFEAIRANRTNVL